MKRINIFITIFKVVCDYIAILSAFAVSYFIRLNFRFSSEFPFDEYFIPALCITPFWLVVMYYARGYKIGVRVKSFRHFERIVFVSLVGIAVYLLTFFFLRKILFSRAIILLIIFFSVLLIWGSHMFFSYLSSRFYMQGKGSIKTLIIGTGRVAKRLVSHLIKERSIHQPVAIIDGYGTKETEIHGIKIVGRLNKLEDTFINYNIEQIIQTDNIEQTINIINFAVTKGIKYAMLPALLGVYGNKSKVDELEGVPVVRVS